MDDATALTMRRAGNEEWCLALEAMAASAVIAKRNRISNKEILTRLNMEIMGIIMVIE